MSPKALLWTHIVVTVLLGALWVLAGYMGWLKSVVFVSHISMATWVWSGFLGITAALTDVHREKDNGN
jgi:hypothetical protein